LIFSCPFLSITCYNKTIPSSLFYFDVPES
jgi:hypothetical protein